jgi:hypothetical protein
MFPIATEHKTISKTSSIHKHPQALANRECIPRVSRLDLLLVLKSSNTTFTIDKQKQQQQTWEMCAIPHGHGAGFSSLLAILLQ